VGSLGAVRGAVRRPRGDPQARRAHLRGLPRGQVDLPLRRAARLPRPDPDDRQGPRHGRLGPRALGDALAQSGRRAAETRPVAGCGGAAGTRESLRHGRDAAGRQAPPQCFALAAAPLRPAGSRCRAAAADASARQPAAPSDAAADGRPARRRARSARDSALGAFVQWCARQSDDGADKTGPHFPAAAVMDLLATHPIPTSGPRMDGGPMGGGRFGARGGRGRR